MARINLVLEDDSFEEVDIADDYDVLREFRDTRMLRDSGESDAAGGLGLISYGAAEDESWSSPLRSSKPRRI